GAAIAIGARDGGKLDDWAHCSVSGNGELQRILVRTRLSPRAPTVGASESRGGDPMDAVSGLAQRGARTAAISIVVAGLLVAGLSQVVLGAEPGFGKLFLNGQVVGTVVPPAQVAPGSGQDPFYKVTNGVSGQLGVAGVGPGGPGYHGRDWQVFTVHFNQAPYLLTSGSAVAAAEARGDVTDARHPEQTLRCTITS